MVISEDSEDSEGSAGPPGHRLVLRLSGDLYTKAPETRLRFVRRLGRNIADALSDHGIAHRLERNWSRFYVDLEETGTVAAATEVLTRVFGLQSISEIVPRPFTGLADVIGQGEEFFRPFVAGRRFAVRATRRGERESIPFRSNDVEVGLGRALLPHAAGVDLGHPEVTAHVELEPGTVHFFCDKLRGYGGLPLGVEGRALALVSGGFDSAVAAWLLLKRGVHLDYVFFNLGGAAHRRGVLRVQRTLAERWSYGSRPRLHEVDLRPAVADLQAATSPRYWQILLKRMMLQAGAAVARKIDAPCLVTGDAIGQVSTQTVQNLAVISQATQLPVLRPLLGFNKDEILALARPIGIYEDAAQVAEYCGLQGKRPATRASLDALLAEEAKLGPEPWRGAVNERILYQLRALPPEALAAPDPRLDIEIDHLPEGATVLDVRSAAAYRAGHHPGALHLELPAALAAYPSFGRDLTLVVVCEVGLKSAFLAERLQAAGFSAYHFRGGAAALQRWAAQGGPASGAASGPAGQPPAVLQLLAPALRA